jgi:tetratricopeptide (TPR) repeat protein
VDRLPFGKREKVGQGEVDIAGREMLADMLLEFGQAHEALAEYEIALTLSPNRFNGFYSAGRGAELAGEPSKARSCYSALLKSTANGGDSGRPELPGAKAFLGYSDKELELSRGKSGMGGRLAAHSCHF